MSAINKAIAKCFQSPTEKNLRDLDSELRPRIYAILASLYRRSPEYVQDAYQSAFVKYLGIFRKGKPDPTINYEAYFVAIAKNSLLDELRKERKIVPLDDLANELTAHHSGIDEAQAVVQLFQALARLDSRCQFLLQAHYVNSMPDSEVAERLKVSKDSVPVLVSRCKHELLELIKNDGRRR